MKKITERLLLFLVGLPAILSIAYFFPQYHFLALHIVIVIVVTKGALEIRKLLSQKFQVYSKPAFIFISLASIISIYLYGYHLITQQLFFIAMFLLIFIICINEIFFPSSQSLEKGIERLVSTIFILIYPIFLGLFLSLLTTLQYPNTTALFLLFTVFISDSLAWLFGMLFGKGNRGIFKASPNKSIAGFLGALLGSIAVAAVAYALIPPFNQSFTKTLLLVVITTIAAIIGDLFESVLKRSVNVKDSGNVIIGRGGMMDSIDSLIFATPIFYFLFIFLF